MGTISLRQTQRKPGKARRQAAEARGRAAESFVAEHWRAQGFDVLAQRLRTQTGEIDLIVADTSTLIFLEVKTRKNLAAAAQSVSARQQMRLFQAADTVLAERNDWLRQNIRFDVALVFDGAVDFIHDAIRQY